MLLVLTLNLQHACFLSPTTLLNAYFKSHPLCEALPNPTGILPQFPWYSAHILIMDFYIFHVFLALNYEFLKESHFFLQSSF